MSHVSWKLIGDGTTLSFLCVHFALQLTDWVAPDGIYGVFFIPSLALYLSRSRQPSLNLTLVKIADAMERLLIIRRWCNDAPFNSKNKNIVTFGRRHLLSQKCMSIGTNLFAFIQRTHIEVTPFEEQENNGTEMFDSHIGESDFPFHSL